MAEQDITSLLEGFVNNYKVTNDAAKPAAPAGRAVPASAQATATASEIAPAKKSGLHPLLEKM
ncbi:type IV pili twitching motility protein PilT, partial [Kingella kingae]|nr:type IV pili twitching motility protein PilT [Kingella kingae]